VVVIIAMAFFGFYLFAMDLVFSWAISQVKTLFG
jgi:preprotein translocase subunit SecE